MDLTSTVKEIRSLNRDYNERKRLASLEEQALEEERISRYNAASEKFGEFCMTIMQIFYEVDHDIHINFGKWNSYRRKSWAIRKSDGVIYLVGQGCYFGYGVYYNMTSMTNGNNNVDHFINESENFDEYLEEIVNNLKEELIK